MFYKRKEDLSMKDRLLWVDDEIDILRPHVMFLEAKGYEVSTVTNGFDAVELCRNEVFDLIFLDENMPGMSGLETLSKIKDIRPEVPVIMITKSEEENIMDMAIGAKIADYLIKPVNPNQILLSLKRNLENRKLVDEKSTSKYQQEFRKIGMNLTNKCCCGNRISQTFTQIGCTSIKTWNMPFMKTNIK